MSGVKRFRKKPVVVEAIQWVGNNSPSVAAFTGAQFFRARGNSAQVFDRLHRTWVNVYPGQWVVKGVQGEFYPIAEDILKQTYEQLS